MSFSQRVLELIKEKNIPKSELARAAEIPYTTLDSMLKRDSDTARLEAMFRIAAYLDVSLEELIYPGGKANASGLTEEEKRLLENYRNLDTRGKRTVSAFLRCESESQKAQRPLHKPARSIPVYDAPAAAGAALPLLSDDFSLIPADGIPDQTDFGIKISGDSMEPLIKDQSVVWVQNTPTLSGGDIGIFLLNGESLCKKLQTSPSGCKLISLNPKYAPITVLDTDELKVVGKVLIK
ncbi:MAG: helix-turn-helix domain-containing protein [Ruminococcaceae bacterium]|nr:helix-turn-helix domain-containing protein [Oscillospiraceae bacterium]